MNKKLLAALTYLDHGWSIFPCHPNTKEPAVSWKKYQTKRPTREKVSSWWERWPDANIGVVTGKVSDLVVVDVDTYKGGACEGLPKTGVKAKTVRGGDHYFYRYPDDAETVPSKANVKPGIDVRGDGGYIILAPSYVKNVKEGYEGVYIWTEQKSTGLPPRWVYGDKAQPNEKKKQGWLSDVFSNGFMSGSRNDTCARLAGYLYGKRIPEDVALSQIFLVNQKSAEPLEESEIARTVESVYKTSKRRNTGDKSQEGETSNFRVMPLASFMRKHGDFVASWQIDNWLPDRTIAFTVAPPGHYKTWLLFDLAVSVATGLDFMGEKVQRKGPVILVQQEDFPGQTTQRLEAIIASKLGHVESGEGFETSFPDLSNIPIYLPDDEGDLLRFDNPDCMDKLEEIIKETKPTLVILDPLYSAVQQGNFMADAVPDLMRLKTLRNKYGCSFFLAHHTSKKSDIGRESLWGSQFLNAFLETGWQIRSVKEGIDDKIKVKRHFKLGASPPLLQLDFYIDTTEDNYYYEVQQLKMLSEEGIKEDIRDKIERFGKVSALDYATDEEEGTAIVLTRIANELGLILEGEYYVKASI